MGDGLTRHAPRDMALSPPESLTRLHDVSGFESGRPGLDLWLRTRALSNQEKGFTAVIVVHQDGRVVGYYGLAPSAMAATHVPRSIRTGQPPEPVPCFLLGQLAVDRAWSGRGIGAGLVKHAFRRCVAATHIVAGRAMMVHAIDDEAAAFWRKWGFTPSKGNPFLLFRSMPDIAASMEEQTK